MIYGFGCVSLLLNMMIIPNLVGSFFAAGPGIGDRCAEDPTWDTR